MNNEEKIEKARACTTCCNFAWIKDVMEPKQDAKQQWHHPMCPKLVPYESLSQRATEEIQAIEDARIFGDPVKT